jgi:hypothetical protein
MPFLSILSVGRTLAAAARRVAMPAEQSKKHK